MWNFFRWNSYSFHKTISKVNVLLKYLSHINKIQIQFLINYAVTVWFITYFDKNATFFVFLPRISRQIWEIEAKIRSYVFNWNLNLGLFLSYQEKMETLTDGQQKHCKHRAYLAMLNILIVFWKALFLKKYALLYIFRIKFACYMLD